MQCTSYMCLNINYLQNTMEMIEQVTPVKKNIVILISMFFIISCNESRDVKILDIIIDDFKSVNNSKSISIEVTKDPKNNEGYYFAVTGDSEGFQRKYYSISYNSYTIAVYDSDNVFDRSVFSACDIKDKEAMITTSFEIDDSDERNLYVYVINDSVVEKRMIFNFLGDMVNEKEIHEKWRNSPVPTRPELAN